MRPYLIEGLDCSGKKTVARLVAEILREQGFAVQIVIGPLVQGRLARLDDWLTHHVASPQSWIGRTRRLLYVTEPMADGLFFKSNDQTLVLKVSSHLRAWACADVTGDRPMSWSYEATKRWHIRYGGATLLGTTFDTRVQRHRADVEQGRTNKVEAERFHQGHRELFEQWHHRLDELVAENVPGRQNLSTTNVALQQLAESIAKHLLSCQPTAKAA